MQARRTLAGAACTAVSPAPVLMRVGDQYWAVNNAVSRGVAVRHMAWD